MKNIFALLGLSLLLTGCFEQPKTEKTVEKAENNVKPVEVKSEQATSSVVATTEATSNKMVEVVQTTVEKSVDEAQKVVEKTANALEDMKQNAENAASTMLNNAKDATEKVKQEIVTSAKELKEVTEKTQSEMVTETKELKETLETSKVETVAVTKEVKENLETNVHATQTMTKKLDNVKKDVFTSTKNALHKSETKLARIPEKVGQGQAALKKVVYYYDNELSPEELRVGPQRPLTPDEIAELKYKCRYSIMSAKEIEVYNCGVKEVIIK